MFYHVKVVFKGGGEQSLFKVLLNLGEYDPHYKASMLLEITPGYSSFPPAIQQLAEQGKLQYWFTQAGYEEFLAYRLDILDALDRKHPYKQTSFKVLKTENPGHIVHQDDLQALTLKSGLNYEKELIQLNRSLTRRAAIKELGGYKAEVRSLYEKLRREEKG